jgi:ATP-dependent Clp protease, protease subunit
MSNEINLFGVIGNVGQERGTTAQQIKTQLAKMDQTQPLTVRIDSEGGSVFDGLSMYEAFSSYPGPKKAIIESTAFSIASYIATAFDDVEIAENGYVMIHEPSSGVDGTASDFAKTADLLAKLDQSMVTAYSTKTGLSEDFVRSLMQEETFLNASEALNYGFVNSISPSRVQSRISPTARHTKLPQRVYVALFGAGPVGETSEETTEKPMSNTQKPVAASIKEIKAAFPKMKDSFFVRCMEEEMAMEDVKTAAADELMAENQELMAKCQAMEDELTSLRAKAMEIEVIPEEETEEETAKATAKAGTKPVAKSKSASAQTATEKWNAAIDAALPQAKTRFKAVAIANKKNPGLREQMLAESNA